MKVTQKINAPQIVFYLDKSVIENDSYKMMATSNKNKDPYRIRKDDTCCDQMDALVWEDAVANSTLEDVLQTIEKRRSN